MKKLTRYSNVLTKTKIVNTFILLFSLFLALGCATKQEKAHQYFNENKGELAEKCDNEFPNDTIKVTIGETIIKTDTLYSDVPIWVECPPSYPPKGGKDSPDPSKGGEPVFVECPPGKTITVTKERTDTITITDTRKTKSLEYKLGLAENRIQNLNIDYSKIQTELDKTKKSKNNLWLVVIVLGVALISGLGYKISRLIT